MKKIVLILLTLLFVGACTKPEQPGGEGKQKTEYQRIEQPE
jgi:hypothetical protein